MQLKLTAADKTDVGKQREQNEDCAYKRIESLDGGDRGLFIVADGMGGYQAGEVASKLAVDTISRAMDSFFKPLPPTYHQAAALSFRDGRPGQDHYLPKGSCGGTGSQSEQDRQIT